MAFKEKLIRDKLDARIQAEQLRIATDPCELERLLVEKLDEEMQELAAEYADVFEVLFALASRRGIAAAAIEGARQHKRKARGGFERGLVWRGRAAVTTPTTDQ
jgi:predicted house-cleaning noncanonical NTP pyrophosphatase (MazG superfamily)